MEEREIPIICLLGSAGAGKSALANAICGEKVFATSMGIDPSLPGVKHYLGKWGGKGESIHIIDTPGFVDSTKYPEQQQLTRIKELSGLRFILVINGQQPRIDKQTISLLRVLKTFGEGFFRTVSIVFTRWEYSAHALRHRKEEGLTEELKKIAFNKCLREQIKLDTDEYLVKCFFLDSYVLRQPQYEDQTALLLQQNEFDKLREVCFSPHISSMVDERVKNSLKVGQQEEESKISQLSTDEIVASFHCSNTIKTESNKHDLVRQLEIPRICLIGITGTGKSTFGNTIGGHEDLFSVSDSLSSCTSEVKQVRAKWLGTEEEFFIVDTCGFGDNNDAEESQMNDFVAKLKNLMYVNRFFLVFNGQAPRFDKLIQEMLRVFKNILGEEVFKFFSVVFTRWDYDSKSLRDRERKGFSEKSREKELNKYLQENIGIDTDKNPIKCYFVDSSAFTDLGNDDEKSRTGLKKEFEKLKEICLDTNHQFHCINMKEYESGIAKLREKELELQKLELEIKTREENFQNDQKLQKVLEEFKSAQSAEKIKRQILIYNKINDYFEYRPDLPNHSTPLEYFEKLRNETMYRDMTQILKDFNDNDKEIRGIQSKYEKVLVKQLNSELPKWIEKRVIKIVTDEFQHFVNDYPKIPDRLMNKSNTDMKLDISSITNFGIATSAFLSVASAGLLIGVGAGAAAIGGEGLIAGGLMAAIGPIAALTGGVILIIAIPFAIFGLWSREKVVNGMIGEAFKSYSENFEFKNMLKKFAEDAFNIAADKYYNEVGKRMEISESS